MADDFTVLEYGNTVLTSRLMAGLSQNDFQVEALTRYLDNLVREDRRRAAMTPEERAADDDARRERLKAEQEARDAERRRQHEELLTRWRSAIANTSSPLVTDILYLHKPDEHGSCQGCHAEVSGYEYELNDWPCGTFELIEGAVP